MKYFDRYDAINPLSLTDSVNLIAPFTEGEFLRPEHIVYDTETYICKLGPRVGPGDNNKDFFRSRFCVKL